MCRQGAELVAEGAGFQDVAVMQGDDAPHEVGKLTDIARPIVRFQLPNETALKRGCVAASACGKGLREVPGEIGHVFNALAKRRQGKRDDVEAVVEVAAKGAFANHGSKRSVGGGNDADIEIGGTVGSEALDLALLQNAQQLGLKVKRHLTDFVKKNGAAVGEFELAYFVCDRTGKGALRMAEEFTFQQSLRDSSAVDGDKWLVASMAGIMDVACKLFLTAAAFSFYQDICVRRGCGAGAL